MTEISNIRGLFADYKSQQQRKTRKGRDEMINELIAFTDELKVEKIRFEIAWNPDQHPLYLTVINSDTENKIASFEFDEDTYIDQVMQTLKGVPFYAY